MFRKLLLASAGAFLVSASLTAARAADVVDPQAYGWTGPYVGLQGGYGWGDNDVSVDDGQPPLEAIEARRSNDGVIDGRDGSINLDGFIGGLHAGYNWQSDALVLGLEGDIEYANWNGSTDFFAGDEQIAKVKEDLDWLGSLRVRAGFAADRALFYATGGLAVGGAKIALYDTDGPTTKLSDNSDTKWGWTVGGGVEYALTDELSASVEYRYTDLGHIDTDFDNPGKNPVSAKADVAFHAVRAGLTWHFRGL